MKKLCIALVGTLMLSSVAMAQTTAKKTLPPMPEQVVERMKQQMTDRYSKMKPEQLTRRKEMVEKRLADEQNERTKQRLQIELDTLNSLIHK
jgi:uncharacterized protein (DUF2384 family)